MHRYARTDSPSPSLRAALVLLAMVGCTPLAEDDLTDVPSDKEQDSASTDDSDTAADTGMAHDAVLIPDLVLDTLEAEGATRVIVEMRSIRMGDFARASAADRAEMLSRRAADYARARESLVSRLSAETRVETAYTHLPLVTLEVTSEDELARLALDRGVVALHADEPLEPVLAQSLGLINQPEAAAAGHTGAGTAVAILDTGLNYTHSDFGSCTAVGVPADCRVVAVEDFAGADGSLDDNGHGTNVAAIVGGVAPGTDLIGLDVFRDNGLAYTSEVVAGIDWVIDNQATYNIVALNMSLGGGSYTAECPGTSYEIAMAAALEVGVASAVATGNNAWSNKIASPACSPSAVKVGAVYDASYGPIYWSGCTDSTTTADKVTCFSNSTDFIDLLAPGAMIDAGGYQMGGTSQATPHVAGALAVVAAAFPDETPEQWTQRLIDTGVTITDHRNGFDFPRIDVEAAVAGASSCTVSVDLSTITMSEVGGAGTVAVSAGETCDWTVESDAAWLSISPASGTGDGTLTWSVGTNAGDARSTTVSVDSASISFSQSGNAAPAGSIVIDSGAAYTASRMLTLAMVASDANDSVAEMCVANVDGDATVTCSAWETYSPGKTWWSSTGQGEKQVGVWFRDSLGRESAMASDTIVLDTIAPSGSTFTATALDAGALLQWTAASDAGAGVDSYWVQRLDGATTPVDCSDGTRVFSGAGLTTTVTGLANDSTYSFRLCSTDKLGNDGSLATATVTPTESAGGPGSISINDGAQWANSRVVTLALTSGMDSPTQLCLSSTSECSNWQDVADSVEWTLDAEQGQHSVSVWYRNAYGQESPPATASIGLDTQKPSTGSLSALSESGRATLAWSGFDDTTSGIEEYVVVMNSGTSFPSSCLVGTEVYRGSSSSATITGLTNGQNYGARLCAVDAAGNYSAGATTLLAPVGAGGPSGTIVLNNGDTWTDNKRVLATITSSNATHMCLSTRTRCTRFVAVRSAMGLNVPKRPGVHTVYAQFKDSAGNLSPMVSDSIYFDDKAPSDPNITIEKDDQTLQVSWTEASDRHSGVESYIIVGNTSSVTAPRNCNSGKVMWEGTETEAELTDLTNSIPYAIRVCAIDEAGNMSAGKEGVGWPGTDDTAPTGTFVANDDEDWTNGRRVTLTFDVTDDDAGLRDMCVSYKNTPCTSWVNFQETYSYNLRSDQGVQTIYAWVRDHQGNVSEVITDEIGYDNRAPGGGTISAGTGSEAIAVEWGSFGDGTSGIASYQLVYTRAARLVSCSQGTLAYSGLDTSYTVSNLTNGTEYLFGVCAVDNAGNVTRAQTVSQRPASEYDAPTGTITVADDAEYVSNGRTTVTINASDASGLAQMCVSASSACRRWTAFSETSSVVLPRRTGTRTVRVWLKDTQGNVTPAPLTDSVIVDATKPGDGSVTAVATSGGVRFDTSGFSDAQSGLASYVVMAKGGTGNPPKCTTSRAYATHNSTSASTSMTATGLRSGSAYSFRVCGVDAVGNVSSGVVVRATPN